MKCGNCGHDNLDNARFCENCGSEIFTPKGSENYPAKKSNTGNGWVSYKNFDGSLKY